MALYSTLPDQLLAFYKANVTGPNQTLYKPGTLEGWEYAWLKQNGGTRPTVADMQMQLYSKVTSPLIPVGFTYS